MFLFTKSLLFSAHICDDHVLWVRIVSYIKTTYSTRPEAKTGGIQTISLAVLEDILVWVILAVPSAFSLGGSALQGLYALLLTVAFITIIIVIIRPNFNDIHGYYPWHEDDYNVYVVVGCFLLLLIGLFITGVMNKYMYSEKMKWIDFC
jgi:Kef-type K+ transport system membrane component KefB